LSSKQLAPISTENREASIFDGSFNPDMEFRKLALEATYIHMGYTLVDKSMLEGVPMVVLGVTFREGIPRNGEWGDYVSVEAICGGQADLNRNIRLGMLDGSNLTIDPNEPVVFNDGSTGVRRQLAQILHESSLINVGPTPEEKEGLKSQYDRPFQFWIPEDYASTAEQTDKSVGFHTMATGEPLRFLFRNGLRSSEYEWSPGNLATTYYFA
jgi:hypothetical protein